MSTITARQIRHEAFAKHLKEINGQPVRFFLQFTGTAFQNCWPEVLICTITAIVVLLVNRFVGDIHLEMAGHSLTITPIAFLLVFRTNICYSRFWEARGHIGELVQQIRCIARKLGSYHPQLGDLVAAYLIVLPMSIRWDLHKELGQPAIEEEAGFLSPEDVAELKELKAKWPLTLLKWLSGGIAKYAQQNSIDPNTINEWEAHLDRAQAAWAGMTKVQSTPIPFPFTHLAVVLLFSWCITLPFALVKPMGVWMPVTVAVMALALFGVNQAGFEIELPMGVDLNDFLLEDFEAAVEKDVLLFACSKEHPLHKRKSHRENRAIPKWGKIKKHTPYVAQSPPQVYWAEGMLPKQVAKQETTQQPLTRPPPATYRVAYVNSGRDLNAPFLQSQPM